MDKQVQDRATALAAKIKAGAIPYDFEVPGWPSDLPLLPHQKAGAMWLYLTPRALLADSVGTGKTGNVLALLQFLKSKGKLSPNGPRALIVVPAISVYGSWAADGFQKFVPDMKMTIGRGTKKERLAIYKSRDFEVLLTNYEMVLRDKEYLKALKFDYVMMDEADAIKNHSTATTKAMKEITAQASRVVAMTATPIQNNLLDLHSILEALGLKKQFGSKTAFDKTYHDYKLKKIWIKGGKRITVKELENYKNLDHLKRTVAPYYLRRTYKDIEVNVPELKTHVKYVELSSQQKKYYQQIKDGYLKLPATASLFEIKSAYLRLRQCCNSTALIGHEKDYSAKYDWVIEQLTGDWRKEKTVIFSNWKASIALLCKRMDAAGIKYVVCTGAESQVKRERFRQEFWNDPEVQVLIGTTAIEKSLNLQVAKIQVNLDLLYNPSRHEQLAGRIVRVGSVHPEAWVFSLISADTIEPKILDLLRTKQTVADHVFDEESKLFEKLSPKDFYDLIRS